MMVHLMCPIQLNLNCGGSKLKRKRNNNKVSRSQSGYSTTYRRHKKRAHRHIMESRSSPSVQHYHNTPNGDPSPTRRSEQIYHGGAAYIDTMNAAVGYQPAHHKYMRKQQHDTD
eukprot:642774_1